MATVTLSGGDKLEQKLAEIARKVSTGGTLRVGFLENATYPDGTPVAQVAAINNFGAPAKGIPPRPFFNRFIEKGSERWGEQLAAILRNNNFDVEAALNQMGMGMVGQLQQSIIETNEPPLSEVTLLLRSRFSDHANITFADVKKAWEDAAAGETSGLGGTAAKPLVWTGHMLQSVDYEVVTDG